MELGTLTKTTLKRASLGSYHLTDMILSTLAPIYMWKLCFVKNISFTFFSGKSVPFSRLRRHQTNQFSFVWFAFVAFLTLDKTNAHRWPKVRTNWYQFQKVLVWFGEGNSENLWKLKSGKSGRSWSSVVLCRRGPRQFLRTMVFYVGEEIKIFDQEKKNTTKKSSTCRSMVRGLWVKGSPIFSKRRIWK